MHFKHILRFVSRKSLPGSLRFCATFAPRLYPSLKDAEQEWVLIRQIPRNENGFENDLDAARNLPIDTDEAYLSVEKGNPASLRVQIKNGAKIVGEDDQHYYTRIKL